jgi:HD-like signal output (HDOD) protein
MEDAVRAAPVAHQCLLKPCDPVMLRSAIERATSLSELLSSKLLAGIVGSVQDLPVMPRAYIELRETLANPNYSLKKIVQIVEQDVGISAKILQLVNSAFFGLPKEISSVHSAVCYLGAEMLQNLGAVSGSVSRVCERQGHPGLFV